MGGSAAYLFGSEFGSEWNFFPRPETKTVFVPPRWLSCRALLSPYISVSLSPLIYLGLPPAVARNSRTSAPNLLSSDMNPHSPPPPTPPQRPQPPSPPPPHAPRMTSITPLSAVQASLSNFFAKKRNDELRDFADKVRPSLAGIQGLGLTKAMRAMDSLRRHTATAAEEEALGASGRLDVQVDNTFSVVRLIRHKRSASLLLLCHVMLIVHGIPASCPCLHRSPLCAIKSHGHATLKFSVLTGPRRTDDPLRVQTRLPTHF